jgi:hypothetical protein
MFLKEEERRQTGRSVKDYKIGALNAINQVKAMKLQLSTLLIDVNADINGPALYYVASDATDIQSVIDFIDTEVAKI